MHAYAYAYLRISMQVAYLCKKYSYSISTTIIVVEILYECLKYEEGFTCTNEYPMQQTSNGL